MADIFLSYARQDLAKARLVANELEGLGWSVFWDHRILHGKDFTAVIQEQITLAKCVIVLWSMPAVKSTFVRDEAGEGKKYQKLVPALIEDVEPPLGFRQFQAADLIHWDGAGTDGEFDRFVRSITAIIGSHERELDDAVGASVGRTMSNPQLSAQQPARSPAAPVSGASGKARRKISAVAAAALSARRWPRPVLALGTISAAFALLAFLGWRLAVKEEVPGKVVLRSVDDLMKYTKPEASTNEFGVVVDFVSRGLADVDSSGICIYGTVKSASNFF